MAALLLVRATINMRGLRRGEEAWVDQDVPYIAAALAAEHLVVVEDGRAYIAAALADGSGGSASATA